MNKSRIEWCDYTWNPITGCRHGCEYCYAKGIAKRFAGDVRLNMADERCKQKDGIYVLDTAITTDRGIINYPFGFAPTIHNYRFDWPGKVKNGAKVFVGAMTDLFGSWVPDFLIKKVFDTCEQYPQHVYIFLTKNPRRYLELHEQKLLPCKENYWFGTTVTKPADEFIWVKNTPYKTFVSIEPILEPFGELNSDALPDWVIVGAETGNRKDKVVPERWWVEEIAQQCKKHDIPLFMKNSLQDLMKEDFVQEWPKQLKNHFQLSQKLKNRLYDKCVFCSKEMPMKEMIALLYRARRGEGAKRLGYSCHSCFEPFKKSLNSGEGLDSEKN